MEKDYKCSLCSQNFNFENIPFEIPCGHSFCFDCLKKSKIDNEDILICAIDKKKHNIKFDKIPISNFYLNFSKNYENFKFKCEKHVKEDIKFVHNIKAEFICSLCLLDNEFPKKIIKTYQNDNLFDDLDRIEKKLQEVLVIIRNNLKEISEFRMIKSINSKEIKHFFDKIIDFFNKPIEDKLNLYYPLMTKTEEKENKFAFGICNFAYSTNQNIYKPLNWNEFNIMKTDFVKFYNKMKKIPVINSYESTNMCLNLLDKRIAYEETNRWIHLKKLDGSDVDNNIKINYEFMQLGLGDKVNFDFIEENKLIIHSDKKTTNSNDSILFYKEN